MAIDYLYPNFSFEKRLNEFNNIKTAIFVQKQNLCNTSIIGHIAIYIRCFSLPSLTSKAEPTFNVFLVRIVQFDPIKFGNMLRISRLKVRSVNATLFVRCFNSESELVTRKDNSGVEKSLVGGAPAELSERVVRIYKEAASVTQSGKRNTVGWRLDWDIVARANRWEDTAIGYNASGDYMQATQMHFRTREDAIRFATNQGWDYFIQEPQPENFKPKQYADNFLHHSGKLKMIHTK